MCSGRRSSHFTMNSTGSAPDTKAGREALAEVRNIMETVVELSVKLTVDSKIGPNWGCK